MGRKEKEKKARENVASKRNVMLDVLFCFLAFAGPMAFLTLTMQGAVNFGDSAEFVTASSLLGGPHPSGYPLYTLVGHIFTELPLGSPSWNMCLMSAFFAALSMLFLYLLTYRLTADRLVSLLTTFAFTTGVTFWGQARIIEVYAMHGFFGAAALYLVIRYIQDRDKPRSEWLLVLMGLVFGLGFTNHLTMFLFVFMMAAFFLFYARQYLYVALPVGMLYGAGFLWAFSKGAMHVFFGAMIVNAAVVLWGALTKKKRILFGSLMVLLFFAALQVYWYTPWQSATNVGQKISWGDNLNTWRGFYNHTTGQEYLGVFGKFTLRGAIFRSVRIISEIFNQFHIPGMFLMLLGLIEFYYQKRREFFMMVIYFASVFIYLVWYTIDDYQGYLIPMLIGMSALVGYGFIWLKNNLVPPDREKVLGRPRSVVQKRLETILIVIMALLPLFHFAMGHHLLYQHTYTEYYASSILENCEKPAIIMTDEDGTTFSMWYYNYVLNARKWKNRENLPPEEQAKVWDPREVSIFDVRLYATRPWFREHARERHADAMPGFDWIEHPLKPGGYWEWRVPGEIANANWALTKDGRKYHFYISMFDHHRNKLEPEKKDIPPIDLDGFTAVNRGELSGFLNELVPKTENSSEYHLKAAYLCSDVRDHMPVDLKNEFLADEDVYVNQEYFYTLPVIPVDKQKKGEEKKWTRRVEVDWEFQNHEGDWIHFGNSSITAEAGWTRSHFKMPETGFLEARGIDQTDKTVSSGLKPKGKWRVKIYMRTEIVINGERLSRTQDKRPPLSSTLYFTIRGDSPDS